jgi:hypothetical protein
MTFSNQILKNIKDNKIILVGLLILVLILLFIQFVYKKNTTEGFTVTPTPTPTRSRTPTSSPTSSPTQTAIPVSAADREKAKRKIFFINNFPKQNFTKIYETKMGDDRYISFWQRITEGDYFPLGQVAVTTDEPATIADLNSNMKGLSYLVKGGSFPIDYEKIWDNQNNAEKKPLSFWKPIPPKDHIALGDIAVSGFDKPLTSIIKCLPISALYKSKQINKSVWKYPLPREKTKSGEEISPPGSFSVWDIGEYNFFYVKDSYQRPDNRIDNIYKIDNSMLENQENDPSDDSRIIKVVMKI